MKNRYLILAVVLFGGCILSCLYAGSLADLRGRENYATSVAMVSILFGVGGISCIVAYNESGK